MKINVTNTADTSVAIYQACGLASKHIHTPEQIERDANTLYGKLVRHLPKRLLLGSVLRLSSRPMLPRAYGSRKVIHTVVDVEICPTGLFVVAIKRHEDWATDAPGHAAWAVLPDAVKDHLKAELYREAITL